MDHAMSFPFRVTELGAAALSPRQQAVREQLEQLLLTIPGERVNRPDFGCGIQRLVFDGTDPLALAAAEYVINTAVRQHLRELLTLDAVTGHGRRLDGAHRHPLHARRDRRGVWRSRSPSRSR